MSNESAVIGIKSEQAFLDDQAQQLRASVYELLGRLLASEPDEPLLSMLRSIEEVDASDGSMALAWTVLKQAALKYQLAAVTDEYTALFIGVGRGELMPYGSWYLTGFLMEKPLALLRTDLKKLGIERQQTVKESEDHIAALCDAMAIIIRSGSEVPLARQQAFFNTHLLSWTERFWQDLQQAESAEFYRAVGFLGEAFFHFEKQLLTMQS